jgi:hypothetical protein
MKIKKTVTEKVISANRGNAKKGGPKTERGKATVSQNATKHGLYAQNLRFFSDKEEAAYNAKITALKGVINQDDPFQQALAEDCAVQELRRGRALRMEQLVWQRRNPATLLALETVANSELMGERFSVGDRESGWECTELTLGAKQQLEGQSKNGALAQSSGKGNQLELHAKFSDPMDKAARYSRETARDFYRALNKLLKLMLR